MSPKRTSTKNAEQQQPTSEDPENILRYIQDDPNMQQMIMASLMNPPQAVPPQPAATGRKTIPAFVNKLFNMVNEPSTDKYIHWNSNGTTFIGIDIFS